MIAYSNLSGFVRIVQTGCYRDPEFGANIISLKNITESVQINANKWYTYYRVPVSGIINYQ